MGLEERGVRDNPLRTCPRGVWEYLDGRLRHSMRMAWAHTTWELLWGVPCGPHPAQVPGWRNPMGLLAVMEQYSLQVRRPSRMCDTGLA